MSLNEVFEAIKSEREYQDKNWGNQKLSVLGEVVLLEHYLNLFKKNYAENYDAGDKDVPELCLHDIRKLATILVRAMENNGALKR